jgi:ATP:corrinoid adenosyltransferase
LTAAARQRPIDIDQHQQQQQQQKQQQQETDRSIDSSNKIDCIIIIYSSNGKRY